jgi:hypothetical protein
MTYQQSAQQAIDCQDASNLSGVLATFKTIVHEVLWPEARRIGRGTDWINRHPICYLFTYKLLALNGHEPLDQYEAYDQATRECGEIARSAANVYPDSTAPSTLANSYPNGALRPYQAGDIPLETL